MGQEQTSVIDAQTKTVEATGRLAVRRRRPAVVAAAAAGVIALAVGAVVWSTSGGTAASAESRATGATRSSAPAGVSDAAPSAPAAPAPADASPAVSSSAAPASGKASTPAAPVPAPAGWESRTFQGVTFSVPPGATAPDLQDPGNADAPATFAWTGPSISDGIDAQITVRFYPADQAPAPAPEYRSVTVPGADQAHVRTGTVSEPSLTAVEVQVLSGGRFISIVGMFKAGAEGEQMARDLLASLSVG